MLGWGGAFDAVDTDRRTHDAVMRRREIAARVQPAVAARGEVV
eukprot:SAG11_NODE_12099_length_721_cov_6.451768_1_plen_42_part_01